MHAATRLAERGKCHTAGRLCGPTNWAKRNAQLARTTVIAMQDGIYHTKSTAECKALANKLAPMAAAKASADGELAPRSAVTHHQPAHTTAKASSPSPRNPASLATCK